MQYTMKKFEELTNIELYEVLKLRQEIFIIEQACIYPDIDSNDQNAYHLLAFDGGEMVGCLRILGRGVTFDEVSIGRVVVSKNSRGRGIAKEMMQRALHFIVSEWKERRVKISAQTYVIPLYEGLGFEVVSAQYLEDGIPHADMIFIQG